MASRTWFLAVALLLFSSFTSAQVVTHFNKTVAPDGNGGDQFAYSMASFGSFLVVGAYYGDFNATLKDTGSAYMYDCTSFPCTLVTKVIPSDPVGSTPFSYSLALSGARLAVGAKSAKVGTVSTAGAVYIYSYNLTSVTQTLKLTAPTPTQNENFGASVAISGSLIAVGASYEAASGSNAGAYVYSCDDSSCALITKVTNSTAKYLGRSVAIDGNLLAVGAHGTAVGGNATQGAVYLFYCDAITCTPGVVLTASDGKPKDDFGYSVATKDQLVVVGAYGLDGSGLGAAYAFRCPSAYSCTQIAKLSAPDGAGADLFGISVAISDFLVVIGARNHKVGSISSAGSAYLFDCFEFNCRYVARLSASDPADSEYLGISVAMLDWKVAAGAYQGKFNATVNIGFVKQFDPYLAICACSNSLGPDCGRDRQCACIPGWTGLRCTTDVDECFLGTHNCHAQATCANTQGSFTCTCNPGWVGNGTFCEDDDECLNLTDDCNQNALCTNTIGSFTCACAADYYGDGYACTACNCGTASQGVSCDLNGTCSCRPGGLGTKCDSCAAGRYGSTCEECRDCLNGDCLDGISGNGACLCHTRFALDNDSVCGECQPGYWGTVCTPCPSCNAGQCFGSIIGNGTCICPGAWQDYNSTSFCSSCAPGYAMDGAGQCQACETTCKTCSGLTASECLTCKGALVFDPDQHTCTSNCPSGEYNNASQCTPCHISCRECLGGGTGDCLSCPVGQLYDRGSCRSTCQTPATFNSSGTCADCPLTCSACLNDQPGGCTACKLTNPPLVLDAGNCSARCSKANSYVSSGICHDCDPSCKTCSGPSAAECLSCSAPTSLSAGSCVNVCPSKQFSNGNQVCQDCSDSCGSCSGPSYQECTSCDSSSQFKYREGSTCRTECLPFRFAPAGTFDCVSCFCNNFTTKCDATSGVCLNCQNNTEGTNCDRCVAGYGRAIPFNSTEVCTDLNECKLGTDNCDRTGGTCANAIGTFTCSCKDGFTGNGTFCQDVNECLLNTTHCPENSTCTNLVGSFSCPCNEGFISSGNQTECTLSPADKQQAKVALGAALGSVLGLAAVLSIFLLIMYKLRKGPFARRKKETLQDMIVEMDYGSSAALATNADGGTATTNNMTTMLNTVNEIALPGFLMINTDKQLRMEQDIAAGGGGQISIAVIIDPKLKEENGGKEKVVVKRVTGVASFDEDDNLLLFQQEVAAMSALRHHRFVATLLGFCNTPPTIVVPLYAGDLYGYIHGTDSFKNLPAGHRITFPFQAILAYEIIDAFSVIHTVGIVHRDLKTKNLLLEATPEARFPYKIRVSDFGICRIVQEQGIKNQNFLNIFGVSTRYAAPEVFSRGFIPNATLDPEDEKKTDVYSFAICLWEMFTKQIPWGEISGEEIQKRVGNAERPELPKIKEDAPDKEIQMALVDMIGLCWNQNPHRRPTFKALVDKIHEIKGVV